MRAIYSPPAHSPHRSPGHPFVRLYISPFARLHIHRSTHLPIRSPAHSSAPVRTTSSWRAPEFLSRVCVRRQWRGECTWTRGEEERPARGAPGRRASKGVRGAVTSVCMYRGLAPMYRPDRIAQCRPQAGEEVHGERDRRPRQMRRDAVQDWMY